MIAIEYFRDTGLPKPAQPSGDTNAHSGRHTPTLTTQDALRGAQGALMCDRYVCRQAAPGAGWRVIDTVTGVGIDGFRSAAEARIHATSLLIRNMMHS